MSRKRRGLLSWMIAIIMIFGMSGTVLADGTSNSGTEPEGLKIKVENGYNGEYKIGYYCPFTVTIENGLKDFSGEIQIQVPNDYNTDNLYSLKADIPKGAKESFRMDLPVFGYITRVKVLMVEGKNTVYEKSVTIKPGVNAEMLTLGVLSDSSDALGYLNLVHDMNGNSQPMKVIKLTEANFPENEQALQAFNGIVINDFDTSRLSSKQYDALKKAVNAGTGLLVGTGSYYQKTFGIFTDDFIIGKVGDVKKVTTSGLSGFAGSKSGFNTLLEYADIDLKDGTNIGPDKNEKLIQELRVGKGRILVAGFDLGLESINNWGERGALSSALLKRIFDYRLSTMYQGAQVVGLSIPYYLENFLNNVPELPRPNFMLIIGILAVYILLVAPVSYVVLKKMDRREWMWFISPALGVLFAVIIYAAGAGTRLNGPLVNYINLIESDPSGKSTVTSYASVFSPNRGDLLVSNVGKEKIAPMMYTNYDPNMDTGKDRKIAAKVHLGEKSAIEYKDTGMMSSRIISAGGARSGKGGIRCSINRSTGDFVGEIENNTGIDLEKTYIMFKNNYIEINGLKAGEKRTIKEKAKKTYGDYWQMMNEMFKDPYSIQKSAATMSDAELIKLRTDFQRRQIIEGYAQMMGNQTSARIYAFGKESGAPKLMVNGKTPKTYEKTVIIGTADVSYINGNTAFIPEGVILPKLMPAAINSGVNLNPDGSYLYGNSSDAEIYYEIDKTIAVTELKLTGTGNQALIMKGGPVQQAPGTGNFKEYIWNYDQQKWVLRNGSEVVWKNGDIKTYLGDVNVLRLKYEALMGEVLLPQISVKGTVK